MIVLRFRQGAYCPVLLVVTRAMAWLRLIIHLRLHPISSLAVAVAVDPLSKHLSSLKSFSVDMRSMVVLPPINEPLDRGYDYNDGKSGDAIVHVVACDGKVWWEDEEDGCEDGVCYADLGRKC